jgi:hypothetical protein
MSLNKTIYLLRKQQQQLSYLNNISYYKSYYEKNKSKIIENSKNYRNNIQSMIDKYYKREKTPVVIEIGKYIIEF